MIKYKIRVTGTLTMREDHDHDIVIEHEIDAPNAGQAKDEFKEWVAQKMSDSGGSSFVGTVDAWTVEETQILVDAPFSVEIEITQNVVIDF